MILAPSRSRAANPDTGARLYRFSVDEYHEMCRRHVLTKRDPIEMLEGLLVIKGDTLPPYGVPIGIPPIEIWPERDEWGAHPLRRLSVAEYKTIVDGKILDPMKRHELIEGWVVEKMTHKAPHDYVLSCIQDALATALPKEWCLRIQMGVALDESTLESDIAVVSQPRSQFSQRQPSPHEVELVIEVADATLPLDLGPKRRSYARNSFRCLWIADVPHKQLHIFSAPSGPIDDPVFAEHVVLKKKDRVPLRIRGKVVTHLNVADFFEEK